jgi:hypothetical protein
MIVTGAIPLNNGLFPCTHIHFMTENAVVKWCCYPGIHRPFLEAAPSNISYIMSRDDLSRPAIHLPGPSKPVVAVRFCPLIFSLHPTVPQEIQSNPVNPSFSLPYRLVFAVATLDSLFIYDTQHSSPIVVCAGLHYAAITDIAWCVSLSSLCCSFWDYDLKAYSSFMIHLAHVLYGVKLNEKFA